MSYPCMNRHSWILLRERSQSEKPTSWMIPTIQLCGKGINMGTIKRSTVWGWEFTKLWERIEDF